ncbi:unnamed protein product [Brassica rapa subsp. narinosa]
MQKENTHPNLLTHSVFRNNAKQIMMKNIFVQMTLACLVLALMITTVSAQYDNDNNYAKTPNSSVIAAADIITGLAVAIMALVAGFIYIVA